MPMGPGGTGMKSGKSGMGPKGMGTKGMGVKGRGALSAGHDSARVAKGDGTYG